MSIADHYRTTGYMHVHQDEQRRIVAKPPRREITICPGCGKPMALSRWSNANRLGATYCEITCALKAQAEARDASGGAA